MSGRPWYKRCGADFIEGTMGLSLEEKGAYSLCLDLIYSHGGPIADEPRWLAGVCGVSVRKWISIRQRLIETGKLACVDGRLSNERAAKELTTSSETSRKLAENGSKGGNKTAENKAESNKNNELCAAKAQPIDKSRGEEKREDNYPPAAGDADPDFDEWYQSYPRHIGKGQARRAYKIAKRKVAAEVLLAGARAATARYASGDPQFIPHPATWLNGERWLDELPVGLPPKRRWQDEPEYRGVIA